ncbi:hypothetical protein SDC9_53886 [bioreactor metagenome]|uniref:Uncharacterized protein n=1 Tax=bioreactor metagenome TaxID=1076179 RepID=A0A644WUL9_9ZZZZ
MSIFVTGTIIVPVLPYLLLTSTEYLPFELTVIVPVRSFPELHGAKTMSFSPFFNLAFSDTPSTIVNFIFTGLFVTVFEYSTYTTGIRLLIHVTFAVSVPSSRSG